MFHGSFRAFRVAVGRGGSFRVSFARVFGVSGLVRSCFAVRFVRVF